MILGTMVASEYTDPLRNDYYKAIAYMNEAEKTQETFIHLQKFKSKEEGKMSQATHRLFEDQLILAFRQYTRGIFSYNLFVTLDE